MKIISVENLEEAVKEAVLTLKQGGVIVYPTDTMYGLGTNAMLVNSVDRIFRIKQRPKTKPLPVMIRNMKWAEAVAFVYEREKKILNAIWPGAISVVLPKRREIPDIVTADKNNVALRIPKHDFVDKILGRFGYPITGTSANISGQEPSNKIGDIIEMFKKQSFQPDLIIDAGDLPKSEPSTILDLSSLKPKILRIGLTKPETLLKLLEL